MKRPLVWAMGIGMMGAACSASPSGTASVTGNDGGLVDGVDTAADGGVRPCVSDPCPRTTVPPGTEVDELCTDGKYTEQPANPNTDLTAREASFSAADYRGTAAKVLSHIGVMVHECGHVYDGGLGTFSATGYQITEALRFTCNGASYTGASATFARKSGDQGFNLVLEEAVQYVNSLATARAFEDEQPQGRQVSERDGILTYLWYVERYLHMARIEYPAQYTYLMADKKWRDAILTMWDRAWISLDATKRRNSLGIADAKPDPLVHDSVLLDEIQREHVASGCK